MYYAKQSREMRAGMNQDLRKQDATLFPTLTSSEYGALVALATKRSTGVGMLRRVVVAGPRTTAYIEHRLVLLGLAIRVANSGDDSRSELVLSTAGQMLVNDVHERDCSTGLADCASRGQVAHDFGQWSPRPHRSLHRHAEKPKS